MKQKPNKNYSLLLASTQTGQTPSHLRISSQWTSCPLPKSLKFFPNSPANPLPLHKHLLLFLFQDMLIFKTLCFHKPHLFRNICSTPLSFSSQNSQETISLQLERPPLDIKQAYINQKYISISTFLRTITLTHASTCKKLFLFLHRRNVACIAHHPRLVRMTTTISEQSHKTEITDRDV